MRTEDLRVDGLGSEVTATTDPWGIRHITAATPHDVFFAQGYFAAVDRLFQIDWWRRQGLGLTAEVLGPDYVERDRAARLLLYRGDMDAEWRSYGDRARDTVTAFVAGINARIDRTRDDPDLLPPEFALLDYTPGRWAPEDVVRIRFHGIFMNIEQEIARAITIRDLGPEVDDLRKPRQPPDPVQVPDGLDLSCLDLDVLATLRLARGPVLPVPQPPADVGDGSNNWAVAPGRTTTGRPILASDPHRAMTFPSLRYLVHLTCPEFDVIGAGEPMLPGISLGHNGQVAFGLTIFPTDQEDLYVYDLNPDDPTQYWYREDWATMTSHVESVDVTGEAPRDVELQLTVHGPVIHVDTEASKAFAVRAAWLKPGMAPYLNSLHYLTAASTEEFRAALDHWRAPGVNQVVADTQGHIGLMPRGLVPIRPNWDGLLPVPGDGRYEWAGFRTADELPTMMDPPCGWVASANEMNLPTDGSWSPVPISAEWFPTFRADRIRQGLDADPSHTIGASAALQNDYVSVVAQRVLGLLHGVDGRDPDTVWALELLRGWDHRMEADSVAATVFESWTMRELRRHLFTAAVTGLVPERDRARAVQAVDPDVALYHDPTTELRLLEELRQQSPPELARVVDHTLGATVRRLVAELGQDRSWWTWGRGMTTNLAHPLFPLLEAPPSWMAPRADAKSGSFQTVGVATYDPATGVQNGGASFRMVVDVGAWDHSIAINTPGQSGDPRSSHADDLYATWLEDGYVPLVYSARAVAENAEETITLRPPA